MSGEQHQPTGESFGRRCALGLAILLAGALLMGFLLDVFSGFALLRGARSLPAWVIGTLLLGALYLAGELIAEWIHDQDRTTDPLAKRLARLLALFILAGGLGVAMIALMRAVK